MEPAQILHSNKADLPGEVWKEYPNIPAYSVSSLGRIRSGARIMKQSEAGNGYLRVALVVSPKVQRQIPTHTAVLETFAGARPEGTEAAHLNGDHLDNRLTNLQWCTREENNAHKELHGTRTPFGEANPNSRICDVARTLMWALHSEHGWSSERIANACGQYPNVVRRILVLFDHKKVNPLPPAR